MIDTIKENSSVQLYNTLSLFNDQEEGGVLFFSHEEAKKKGRKNGQKILLFGRPVAPCSQSARDINLFDSY